MRARPLEEVERRVEKRRPPPDRPKLLTKTKEIGRTSPYNAEKHKTCRPSPPPRGDAARRRTLPDTLSDRGSWRAYGQNSGPAEGQKKPSFF